MSGPTIESPRPEADRWVARGPGDSLYAWRPLLCDLALGLSRNAGHVLVLTDSGGDVLWVDGEQGLVEQALALGLAPGVRWAGWADVRCAEGAAAPAETGWGCWASPVFDPRTADLLGVLAVCGPTGTRDTLLLVRAVARLAEELVLRDRLHTPRDDGAGMVADPDGVHLRVLGPGFPVAEVAGARVALTPRRADILFLLARHADGLSADALAQELYGDTGNPLTVRVEVHRSARCWATGSPAPPTGSRSRSRPTRTSSSDWWRAVAARRPSCGTPGRCCPAASPWASNSSGPNSTRPCAPLRCGPGAMPWPPGAAAASARGTPKRSAATRPRCRPWTR